MADITADTIGLETGHYRLPCGCRIYVFGRAEVIHLSGNTVGQCDELRGLWTEYSKAYWDGHGHSCTSLNLYLACLRHVGAGESTLHAITALRDSFQRPADHNRES
ncbi:hypothetical protein OG285_32760 [Streptomyces sp. NBC_01471]|uniref:hypothetical protein n=1 Tax=Streptomyces sp. NBC_01471 TaxID=2903879 RepID=UPI003254AF7F